MMRAILGPPLSRVQSKGGRWPLVLLNYREAGAPLPKHSFPKCMVEEGVAMIRKYDLGRRRTNRPPERPPDGALGDTGPVQKLVIALKLQR